MHQHSHDPNQSAKKSKNTSRELRLLFYAFFLNFCFTLIEFGGASWTNSMSIYADALHDAGDSLSLMLALLFAWISKKRESKNFSYGLKRFSLLGAWINSVILVSGSALIILESIDRIQHPESVDASGMFIIAVLGILFNGIALVFLHRGESLNSRAIFYHLLEDVLGWFIVLISSSVLFFYPVYSLDTWLSIALSLFISYNAFRIFRKSIRIMLQSVPEGFNLNEIQDALSSISGVCQLHHTHLWSLDGQTHVFSTHMLLCERMSQEDKIKIKKKARDYLVGLGMDHITLEIEEVEDECTMREIPDPIDD